MKFRIIAFAGAFIFMAMPFLAETGQQAQPKAQAPAQPSAQPGPHPKSQKELEALQKVQAAAQANNPDAEIQAINDVLENFVDTEFKPQLLSMAMQAAERKGDFEQAIVWGERAMQNNPNDFGAPILLAALTAQHTRENDLDKDQSLKKADDYANKGLDLLKRAPATPPFGFNGTAADWADYKKDEAALAHDALGQTAALRKKYPEAIEDFKTSLNEEAHPNPISQARLAKAYVDNKQYDDAIATADKVLAMNGLPAEVKQFAQQQKDAATKLKGSAK